MNHDESTAEERGRGSGRFEKLRATIAKQIRERPLTCAGLTLAAGFVIGGGLATGTTLRVLRRSLGLTLQMAVVPALLTRLRDAVLDGDGALDG